MPVEEKTCDQKLLAQRNEYIRLEHLLKNELRRTRVEVLHLYAHSLLELGIIREIGGRWHERRLWSLSGVFDGDVPADGA